MTTPAQSSTILLVEDDQLLREIAAETLRDAGYSVVTASDGQEALRLLPTVRPDLILSDVRMPNCTGFELLQRVRGDAVYNPTPFIFMSAKAETADQRQGMSLGADDYVTKPYLPEDLLKTIEVRLARSALSNELISRQQRFLSRVLPHELRTPLSGVVGYADMLTEMGRAGESISAEELVEFGSNLQRSGARLMRVADDFSLWSWLEIQYGLLRLGKPAALTQIQVKQSEVEEKIWAAANDCGRKRDVTLDLQPAIVTVPAEGFARVVLHLVENAMKFSLPASPVHITGFVQGSNYVFSVRDEGRGMTQSEIERVGMLRQFAREKFEQQGWGIGLGLALSFARLGGGDLSITGNQPEAGITVRMTLRLAAGP
jgi:CheY-like chemotaxis protein